MVAGQYLSSAPYALAYSEHLFTAVVMALPVWLATHNVILAYNLVFLASMALSGLSGCSCWCARSRAARSRPSSPALPSHFSHTASRRFRTFR